MSGDLFINFLFYGFVVLLAVPFLALAAFALRLIKLGVPEALMMLPGFLLGLVIFDVMLFEGWISTHTWSFPMEFLAIAGWLFFLPAFVVLLVLHIGAILGIIVRTEAARLDQMDN